MEEETYSSPPIPYVQSSPPNASRNLEYELTMRQEPKQARMCGIGGKADRRPIDPPPIIQLRVIDKTPSDNCDGGTSATDPRAFLQNPYYFMFASLAKPDLDEELHWLKDGRTRCTTGSVVSSLYHLKDAERDNEDVGFFVFPDLSVRTEGSYRLKLSLFEIYGSTVRHCKSIFTAPFYVYTAKKFPGMEESSTLSCSLAEQGIKIRIRKDTRRRNQRNRSPAPTGSDKTAGDGNRAGSSESEEDDTGVRRRVKKQQSMKAGDDASPTNQKASIAHKYPLDRHGQLIRGVTFDDAGRPIPRDAKEAEEKGLLAVESDGGLVSADKSGLMENMNSQWQNETEAASQSQSSDASTAQQQTSSPYYPLPTSGTYPPPPPPPPQPIYQAPQQYYPPYQPQQTWYDYQQPPYPPQHYPPAYHQPPPPHQPPYHPHYAPQPVPHPHYTHPPQPPYWYGGYYSGSEPQHPHNYPPHPPPEYPRTEEGATASPPNQPPRYWDQQQQQQQPQVPQQSQPQPQPNTNTNAWGTQPAWDYHQQQQPAGPITLAPLRRVRGRDEMEADGEEGEREDGSARKKRVLSIGSIVEGSNS